MISRFVASQWFVCDAHTRRTYLGLLGESLERTDWRCFAYAIMSNHIHLGVIAGYESLADWTRAVNRPFAEWMNVRHARIGAVFLRPTALEVAPRGIGTLIAYIHCNPVRAGVVQRALDSDWTSHRAYAGRVEPPGWLDLDAAARLAGVESAQVLARGIDDRGAGRSELASVTCARPRGRPARGDRSEGVTQKGTCPLF